MKSTQNNAFIATIFFLMFLKDTTPMEPPSKGTKQEENPLRNHSIIPHQIQTTSINRTNASIESTTPTAPTVRSRGEPEIVGPTTVLQSEEIMTSQPTSDQSSESGKGSASPRAQRNNKRSKQVTLLSVLVALAVCLSVGVVVAVFFVRWKKIKKMKKGFQEEMATICLHDELASEALYSSWKPFMDTGDNNKMKLVIEPPGQNVQKSGANT